MARITGIAASPKSYELIVTARDWFFINHTALLVEENNQKVVYHIMPDMWNQYGGNVIVEPLNNFLKGREIVAVRPLTTSPEQIRNFAMANATRIYDKIYFNCEHFNALAQNKAAFSPQVRNWVGGIAVGSYLATRIF